MIQCRELHQIEIQVDQLCSGKAAYRSLESRSLRFLGVVAIWVQICTLLGNSGHLNKSETRGKSRSSFGVRPNCLVCRRIVGLFPRRSTPSPYTHRELQGPHRTVSVAELLSTVVPPTSVVVVIVNGPAHALVGTKNGNEMVFDVPAGIVN